MPTEPKEPRPRLKVDRETLPEKALRAVTVDQSFYAGLMLELQAVNEKLDRLIELLTELAKQKGKK